MNGRGKNLDIDTTGTNWNFPVGDQFFWEFFLHTEGNCNFLIGFQGTHREFSGLFIFSRSDQ